MDITNKEISGKGETEKRKEGKYLTFNLKNEDYGIEILKIKEIIGMMEITTIPQTPRYVKGVINLRGKVIPVIDLRLKFGLEEASYTERTCIVVVDICGVNRKNTLIGIVVDAVSEVLNIRGSEIEDTPDFGVRLNTQYIHGIAKTGNGVKILLNIDMVLSGEDVLVLDKAA